MTREKMTTMLCETLRTTPQAAEAALEASQWNVLDAARLLQREQARARKAEAARAPRRGIARKPVDTVRGLLARASRREPRPIAPVGAGLSAAMRAPLMLMPAVYACL